MFPNNLTYILIYPIHFINSNNKKVYVSIYLNETIHVLRETDSETIIVLGWAKSSFGVFRTILRKEPEWTWANPIVLRLGGKRMFVAEAGGKENVCGKKRGGIGLGRSDKISTKPLGTSEFALGRQCSAIGWVRGASWEKLGLGTNAERDPKDAVAGKCQLIALLRWKVSAFLLYQIIKHFCIS